MAGVLGDAVAVRPAAAAVVFGGDDNAPMMRNRTKRTNTAPMPVFHGWRRAHLRRGGPGGACFDVKS
ncbi:hypothetical protein KBI5_22720 [Frankia sp. KB5]|nr:hypothetical protein KBI5_22720 [Frankia sp. KB5]